MGRIRIDTGGHGCCGQERAVCRSRGTTWPRSQRRGDTASSTNASEAEAVKLVNDTEYGLAAGVWIEDMRQAQRMVNALEAGTI